MNESLSLLSFLDAPLLVGDPDGCVIYFNPAFERTFGVDASRARGQELAAMFSGGGREAVLGSVAKVCSGEGTQRFRLREDGKGYLVVASPIQADADHVGVIILLTDEPLADEKLLSVHREIAEPLAEAHDCLEELIEESSASTEIGLRPLAEKGLAAIERARKCSDSLPALLAGRGQAKARKLHSAPFDPVETIRAALAQVASELSAAGVELVVMMPAHLPSALGDAARLKTLIARLLTERASTSPAGAPLTVSARVAPAAAGEALLISVIDAERGSAGSLVMTDLESETAELGAEVATLTHPVAGRVTSLQLRLR